jgi:predicted ArsR family transcriptional regulator
MQPTRERILNILKERGQVTVDELGKELGLTAVTVRHHLDILRGEGLISAPLAQRRKAPGRPKHVYTLTEKASAIFPKRYSQLTDHLLDEIRALLAPDQVSQMMQRIGERMAEQAAISNGDDFETRLTAVVKFLNELGYMAQWEQNDDGDHLLHIANCPYEQVSQHNPEVCAVDMAMLTRLLGAPPQRITSSAQGDHQCTYAIQSLGE